jgi:hypothetical protein
MIAPELSALDKARIAYFEEQCKAVGFDGDLGLAPNERGILAIAGLVRVQTLLQVFKALGMSGRDAADISFKAVEIDVPANLSDAQEQLRQLLKFARAILL